MQDYVRNQLELRCFVVDGRVAHIIYSSFERVDFDGYPRDFVKHERDGAIKEWLDGDAAAMEDAEKKAYRLVKQWLTWLRCRSAEPTPCIRMDILVSKAGPGKADVRDASHLHPSHLLASRAPVSYTHLTLPTKRIV